MTTDALPRAMAAPAGAPVKAMITAAKSTYDASNSDSAAAPTRQGPGR